MLPSKQAQSSFRSGPSSWYLLRWADVSAHAVIIQTLWTRWTKRSRGAPAATRRNATPESFDIDPARIVDGETCWHEVRFDEPEFIPVETYRTRSLPSDFHRISIQSEGPEVLGVQLFGSTCFRLIPRQLGRVLYTLSEDVPLDDWYATTFHKLVFQVAFGLSVSPALFRRPPNQQHVSMRELT